jgi:hypothetical protein
MTDLESLTPEELDALVETRIMDNPGRWVDRVCVNDRWADIRTWLPDRYEPDRIGAGMYAGQSPRRFSQKVELATKLLVDRQKTGLEFLVKFPQYHTVEISCGDVHVVAETLSRAICILLLRLEGDTHG